MHVWAMQGQCQTRPEARSLADTREAIRCTCLGQPGNVNQSCLPDHRRCQEPWIISGAFPIPCETLPALSMYVKIDLYATVFQRLEKSYSIQKLDEILSNIIFGYINIHFSFYLILSLPISTFSLNNNERSHGTISLTNIIFILGIRIRRPV